MADAKAEAETVTVSIFDKSYQISCQSDEVDSLHRSASFLDKKMREVKTGSTGLGADRIAVMAALNITNDLLGETDKTTLVIKHQAGKIQTLSKKLDLALTRIKKNH